jgi:hypothetical protein
MFKIVSSGAVKFRTDIVVPITFAATITFSLHTVVAVCVWLAQAYALTYFLHDGAMQDFFNAVGVEIAQHVGIAGTAGFYIAPGIDM